MARSVDTKLEDMAKTFRPYDLNQHLLLPPDLRDWLPEGHLALFVSDVVDELNLAAIVRAYDDEERGQPPYHPAMMVKLLLYAYCTGRPSSRRIERATHDDVACRVLAPISIQTTTALPLFASAICRPWPRSSCKSCSCVGRRAW